MNIRIQSRDKALTTALEERRMFLERAYGKKFTSSEAAVQTLKEVLLPSDQTRLRSLETTVRDLANVIEEQKSAENILIYTLLNGTDALKEEDLPNGKGDV